MRVDLFDFDLPETSIALRPANPRDSARMLVVRPDGEPVLSDHDVLDLPSFLRPGDALVFNDTKVIPAQLEGLRRRSEEVVTQVSLTLHMRVAPDRWKAFARPARRLKPGDRISFGHGGNSCLLGTLDATVEEKADAGEVTLRFDLSGPALDEAIMAVGHTSLPPISHPNVRTTRGTAPTIRPSMRGKRGPSRHRPPDCISPNAFSQGLTRSASSAIS